ncbi:MAG TPA: Ppx/GppA phosphatase family protein [Chthonomonadales bacterium]|nr:Ppx/GppA phosphatase family protein [Chthonomonadales bacterium]
MPLQSAFHHHLMTARDRFASIDVGSNTVKLTIVERNSDGAFMPLWDMSRTTRLGEGIHARRLREAAIRRTLDVLREYVRICRRYGVQAIAAVGTSALREAVNREDFLARAREVGVEVEVISGEEEARLSYLAVRYDPCWRTTERLLVVDIGGGSTEIVMGDYLRASPGHRISLALGGVRLTEAALRSDPPTVQQIAEAVRLAQAALQGINIPSANYTAVGVGGTFVNLAAVRLSLAEHDPERLHGTVLTVADVEAQVALFAARTVEERKKIVGLDPARADIILGGALILSQILAWSGLESIAVSCRGLRWGVLYEKFGR